MVRWGPTLEGLQTSIQDCWPKLKNEAFRRRQDNAENNPVSRRPADATCAKPTSGLIGPNFRTNPPPTRGVLPEEVVQSPVSSLVPLLHDEHLPAVGLTQCRKAKNKICSASGVGETVPRVSQHTNRICNKDPPFRTQPLCLHLLQLLNISILPEPRPASKRLPTSC